MKGIRFKCRSIKCENDKFIVLIDFKQKQFKLHCSKCAKLLYYLETDKEMVLEFEKDYIQQELKKI